MAPQAATTMDDPAGQCPAREVLTTIADGVTAHGFDTRSTAWEESYRLDITNVRGAVCHVTVGAGAAAWEYRPCRGTHLDPTHITEMVLGLLGARTYGPAEAARGRYPGLTFKGIVGRALAERGMDVRLALIHHDDVDYDVYAEIAVTNPAHPGQGRVRLTDEGTICWKCSLHTPATTTAGLTPGEVIHTIVSVLAEQNV
jgi:hypothetical protein